MSDYINDNIKVWVGCLASYNNGQHHGQWIDLEKDDSTLKTPRAPMLSVGFTTNGKPITSIASTMS